MFGSIIMLSVYNWLLVLISFIPSRDIYCNIAMSWDRIHLYQFLWQQSILGWKFNSTQNGKTVQSGMFDSLQNEGTGQL